jgi:hypothetical protein
MQARQRRQRGRREHWPISRRLMCEKVDQRSAQSQLGRSHIAGSSESESEIESESEGEGESESHSDDSNALDGRSKREHRKSMEAEPSEMLRHPDSVWVSSADEITRKDAPPGDVEGWATLRTQLQLALAKAEQAEEEMMLLRSQLRTVLKKDSLTQHASKAMITASRKCSAELHTLRKDKLRLQQELSAAQTDQLATADRCFVLKSNCARLQAERDSLAERLREAERCIRAGATDRVRLEDEAAAATARCERLEAKVLELDEEILQSNLAKARTIDTLSVNAESVAQQVQSLQAAADAQTNQMSQQRLARDVAEHRAATLEHEVAILGIELNATRCELQELKDGSTAAAALAHERKWQVTQRAAHMVIRRLSQQLLFRGFSGWAETVCRLRRAHTLCKQVVDRMQHRLQHVALCAWRARMLSSRRHTAIISRCIQKMHLPAQASTLAAWREYCVMRQRQRLIVHRAVARMCYLVAHNALSSWQGLVAQKRHAQGVVLKHLARMMNAMVYAAWCVVLLNSTSSVSVCLI